MLYATDAEPRRRVAVLDGEVDRARREHEPAVRRQLPRPARRARERSASRSGATCCARSDGTTSSASTSPSTRRRAVTEFLLWHPANPDSVTACVARARENLRGVREQISSEMWEHLNRLHLLVARTRHCARARGAARVPGPGPRGLARLPGRDEGDALARRGVRVPRARRAPRARRHDGARAPDERAEAGRTGSGDRLWSLLRSCGAFEAFRRHESEDVQGERVVEFLLLDRSFPRSVLFCAERCLEAVRFISGNSQQPERSVGMLVAKLTFADVPQLDPPSLGGAARRGARGRPRGRQRARRRLLRDASRPARPLRAAAATT